ncbi:hypothetical protein VTK73DRAFT_4753 [Phialemonium thermophilum]|uniref:Uncharacterized protein n=1 Tax=Phialemonium thermophilum TaxID=223376 RepID=A0ABR3V676_9PEZI
MACTSSTSAAEKLLSPSREKRPSACSWLTAASLGHAQQLAAPAGVGDELARLERPTARQESAGHLGVDGEALGGNARGAQDRLAVAVQLGRVDVRDAGLAKRVEELHHILSLGKAAAASHGSASKDEGRRGCSGCHGFLVSFFCVLLQSGPWLAKNYFASESNQEEGGRGLFEDANRDT